jgi:hypothetical protein
MSFASNLLNIAALQSQTASNFSPYGARIIYTATDKKDKLIVALDVSRCVTSTEILLA